MKKIFIFCVIIFAFVTDSFAHKRRDLFIADSLEHLDAVKSIKGLGQLHIGNTFEQVKSNFNIYSESWRNSEMFGCGRWSDEFHKVGDDVDELYNISQYIYKHDTDIREYTTWDYKIGDIEIGRVSCAFYKNKLVAISFNGTDEIYEHYIKKYGNGCEYFPNGDDYDFLLRYVDRTWANENVILKYDRFVNDVFIISNDGGFDKYLEKLKTYKEMYKDEIKAKRISDLNQL